MSTPAYQRPPNYKSDLAAYLLWILFGAHYLYFRRPGLQLLYWLTIGGVGIWALIDLFRIPGMVDEWNAQYERSPIPAVRGTFYEPPRVESHLLTDTIILLGFVAILWMNRVPIRRFIYTHGPTPPRTEAVEAASTRSFPSAR